MAMPLMMLITLQATGLWRDESRGAVTGRVKPRPAPALRGGPRQPHASDRPPAAQAGPAPGGGCPLPAVDRSAGRSFGADARTPGPGPAAALRRLRGS